MSKQFLSMRCVAGTLVLLLACAGLASAQAIDFGEYHALLIANEKYRHWKPLVTPHEDVADLEKILRERYGFKTKVIKDATRTDIIDELEALKRRLTERDNLLVYYAGHGKIRQDGGYWIGVDASKESRSGWLHYVTISGLLDVEAGMKARHVLVIADSCYSGSVLRHEGVSSQMRANEARVDWLRRTIRTRARTILTAGGTEPVLDRVGTGRNSIFARELLARLRNNVDVMEGQALHGSIKEDVHSRARRVLGSDAQVPDYGRIPGTGHDGGDFLFRPKDVRITAASPDTMSDPAFGIRGSDQDQLAVGVYRPKVGDVFKDCPKCPAMVVVPAGSFLMGSPQNEEGREAEEGPQHRVRISRQFAIGKYEVTRREYATFVEATGRAGGDGCYIWTGSEWKKEAGKSWRDSGFGQTNQDPVVCVSWDDAKAYVEWLSKETGKPYRLPTEAEWEYVARAKTITARHWGEDASTGCSYENGADLTAKEKYLDWTVAQCRDGYVTTAPVGSFKSNNFGLHDMLGNAMEWVEDCWNDSYKGAPTEGSAWTWGDCSHRVLRGGSWYNIPARVRSARRYSIKPWTRNSSLGFRVARTLP